jgi:hypothetical protein
MINKIAGKGRFLVLFSGLVAVIGYMTLALSLGNGVLGTTTLDASQESTIVKHVDPVSGEDNTVGLIILEPEELPIQDINLSSPNQAPYTSEPVVTVSVVEAIPDTTVDNPEQVTESMADHNIEGSSSNQEDVVELIDNSNESELFITLEQTPSLDYNPLLPYIIPGSLEIAKAAIAADYLYLVESGLDVHKALRYIDERVVDGKYGDSAIRN